jgi:pSer/pThr/pTyr-binding forkhead associated (FHA) protein
MAARTDGTDGPSVTWEVGAQARTLILEPDRSPYSIGRDTRCAIRIDDRQASRCHAELFYDESWGWKVADLDSKNGTHLDGKRVQRARALGGEHSIRCGHTVLAFSDPDALLRSNIPLTESDGSDIELTRAHRDVIELLSRPFRDVDDPRATTVRPPSNEAIADELMIDMGTLRKRLKRLYVVFDVPKTGLGTDEKRRELVARAFERGTVARDAL